MPTVDLPNCDEALPFTEAQLRQLKLKRRVVQIPRNLYKDQITLNKREQLRAKLLRKKEQKAKAEAEESKSN